MDEELDHIEKNDTLELVLRPRNNNVIETKWILIQVDIGSHPPIPTGSSWQFLFQHVLLYFFSIVGSTLMGLSESLHIFQEETDGPT